MVVRNIHNGVLFGSLNDGDVFMYGTKYYMKTNKVTEGVLFRNAVMLNPPKDITTMFDIFLDEDEVYKVDAELVIK